MMGYCYRTTANNGQVQKVTLIITGDQKHCLPCKQPIAALQDSFLQSQMKSQFLP